jgi:hypothetical protein
VSKLKKTLPSVSPDKWVPLKGAFERITSSVGDRGHAAINLTEDLRSEQLGSALVEISPEGQKTETLLNGRYWEPLTVRAPPFRVDGLDPNVNRRFFVWRRDLNKRYPMTAAHPSDDTPSTPTTASKQGAAGTRRKPGPKLKHGWRLEVAVEVYRFREKEGRTPSASELAQYCYNKWEWNPDPSDIQKWLRELLND